MLGKVCINSLLIFKALFEGIYLSTLQSNVTSITARCVQLQKALYEELKNQRKRDMNTSFLVCMISVWLVFTVTQCVSVGNEWSHVSMRAVQWETHRHWDRDVVWSPCSADIWSRKDLRKRGYDRSETLLIHCPALLGSHCNSRTIDGSFFAPSTNSSSDSLPEEQHRVKGQK